MYVSEFGRNLASVKYILTHGNISSTQHDPTTSKMKKQYYLLKISSYLSTFHLACSESTHSDTFSILKTDTKINPLAFAASERVKESHLWKQK